MRPEIKEQAKRGCVSPVWFSKNINIPLRDSATGQVLLPFEE
jgi:hypothetical protein